MEVPPGRLERSLSGGKDALAALLTEAAERRLNGLLATSRTREDVPARGVLVFHKGNGSLASHSWRGGLAGAPAVPARVRGASREDAALELRSYDHRGSSIRMDQLESAHPEARIDGLPDLEAVIAQLDDDERASQLGDRADAASGSIDDVRSELR